MHRIFTLLISGILISCSSANSYRLIKTNFHIGLDTVKLYDDARQRNIPVAFYNAGSEKKLKKQGIIIFSHGYGENRPDSYLKYSYLTEFLASKGYFVASIQHELSTDDLIPTSGIPQVVRLPFWERGADNIFYVINYLKRDYPQLNFSNITLIGHSNGGDMIALFPQRHPNLVDRIITLDNRRMALPRTSNPQIYSLRSSDLPADPDVLPTSSEQKLYKTKIIKLTNTVHNDMDDKATEAQRKEIRNYTMSFLND